VTIEACPRTGGYSDRLDRWARRHSGLSLSGPAPPLTSDNTLSYWRSAGTITDSFARSAAQPHSARHFHQQIIAIHLQLIYL
jgi:hypothetical protein